MKLNFVTNGFYINKTDRTKHFVLCFATDSDSGKGLIIHLQTEPGIIRKILCQLFLTIASILLEENWTARPIGDFQNNFVPVDPELNQVDYDSIK